jgi:2-methylcitrate dehydratase PrpD
MTTASTRLVGFLIGLTEKDIGSTLLQHATMAVLDNVACGLYGSRQAWGRIVNDFVLSEGAKGRATLYGSAQPVSPARAALANGTSTHGFELDDTIQGALTHPGAVLVSAALAAAEDSGASGPRLLLAVIAGYEMIARLGHALGAEHNTKGYHTTGVAGPIAAAVAVGIVRNLSAHQLLSAIGIACSTASGIKAFTQGTGGMVKRMHAGHAAEAGVVACELARRGFTGPLEGIDGRFGLLDVIGGNDVRPQALDSELGASFAITRIWVKAYPCCGLIHSTAHALESLKAEHRFTPAQVESIRIFTSKRAVDQNSNPDPREPMAAQYSLQYSAGVAVAKDARDPGAYAQDNLHDVGVRQIAARTRLEVDQKMDSLYPAHFAARVVVNTMDGRNLERTVIDPHGTPADPCSFDEVAAKFEKLAALVKEPQAIEAIRSTARDLASAPSLDSFSKALREGNLRDEESARVVMQNA